MRWLTWISVTSLVEVRVGANLGNSKIDTVAVELEYLIANVAQAQDPESDPYQRIDIGDVDVSLLESVAEYVHRLRDLMD